MSAGNASELILVSLAAMVSPTTLTFSVLALVLGDRPLRTGFWFFLGAFGATTAVGVAGAFVLGAARRWLERHAVTIGYAIALLLGIALLRNGIAGLTS